MQLGFVIDQSRCIGCHACTVACKSENDVPLGSFRTWVKYVEEGAFPEVKRSFSVLRCNQCTDAPCVTICPVTALDKRPDGIVDVDPRVCIGCKACMQGCPYDALYINEDTGTAQKCHFCAHRVEQGLAPACAVVCPTEAIVPGDFHDPGSAVSRMKDEFDLTARKREAGTQPNVLYRDVAEAGIDPLRTNGSGGYLWSQQQAGPTLDAELHEALEARAEPAARTVYNVDRKPLWGAAITGYLFFKSLAAGVFLAGGALLSPMTAGAPRTAAIGIPLLAMICLGVTMLLLVLDLKRPERFLRILLRPNMSSWLAKGSYVLLAYGLALTVWLAFGLAGAVPSGALGWNLLLVTAVLGALGAAYTAWLFQQAKGRVLWMRKGLAIHLVAQAFVAGPAALLVVDAVVGLGTGAALTLSTALVGGLIVHLVMSVTESRLAPDGREEEYARAARLVSHGPFARRHWILGVVLGTAVPILLLHFGTGAPAVAAAVLALVGLWSEEDVLVRAGQALPIS